MGEGQQQIEFHLHPLGQLDRLLAFLQSEQRHVSAAGFLIPAGIEASGDFDDLPYGLSRVPADSAGRVADALLDLGLMPLKRQSEIGNLSAVRMDQIQHGLDRGGLARAVSADEAGDPAALKGKRNITKAKCRICLADIFQFRNLHKSLLLLVLYELHDYCNI